ncbi:unnamed protein product, partial [Ectocarpus sp. 12 AP-2014]
VCRAEPGAAVTSVAIDDRRQQLCRRHLRPSSLRKKSSSRRGRDESVGGRAKLEPNTSDDDARSKIGKTPPAEVATAARAVVFCGDTKGNIRC